MSARWSCTVWLGLLGPMSAQGRDSAPAPAANSLERDARELTEFLATTPAPPRSQQIKATADFLARHGTAQPRHVAVLRARIRLAVNLLHDFQAEAALREFDAVLDVASPTDRDMLGRALYGKAQAQELAGEVVAARTTLEELIKRHAGERYERLARTATKRLEEHEAALAKSMAPELAEAPPDLRGRTHRLATMIDTPVLLVFWSPENQASITRLHSACAAWRRGMGEDAPILTFALHDTREQIEAAVAREKLEVPVIPLVDEFVHPIASAYRVTKLPTVIVVGTGRRLLGRDLSATEIEDLGRLRR